jgi:hypothetical protein
MGKIMLSFIFGMRVKASCSVSSDVFINCIKTKLGEIKIILVFYSVTILLLSRCICIYFQFHKIQYMSIKTFLI